MTGNQTTELLCKLLDERDIEWKDGDAAYEIEWNTPDGRHCSAMYWKPTFTVLVSGCTPEQAVAATLGSEREVELQSALYEVSDKWAQAQIEAEDYARENLLLKAKLDSATLGNGTLTAEQVREAIERHVKFYEGGDYDEQAIADELNAALGSDRELIDLAHNAWSMALCAMHGMPIPAEWGDAVERGLREHGIDVDGVLAAFEVIDDER